MEGERGFAVPPRVVLELTLGSARRSRMFAEKKSQCMQTSGIERVPTQIALSGVQVKSGRPNSKCPRGKNARLGIVQSCELCRLRASHSFMHS